ncbi:hypothetical protein [Lysinibacillus piscis]|uniref:Uncharacterized protein n=1 Tax=Lysinibacillus piscis TaxID=2518931 RepID=A0ABQ5NJ41_9BACI|nr:hypothetical protein [Lysinibacillus sp. KH24]GLC88378.1 hypothetical protein LYSBPC_15050 [Lysinibacillus sp. KH24]
MAILKDYSSVPNKCEVEIKLTLANEESVEFLIYFRSGPAFPVVHMEIACLKRDFFKLLDDLQQIDSTHLSMLETHDPGLCIYHIPQFGEYFYPGYGILQIPDSERCEWEPSFKLIFVLDAGYKNHLHATGGGPSLCLTVKMNQIIEFVDDLKIEMNRF